MLKKIIAAASLAAGIALVAPSVASADTGYQYVNLQPGQTYCARDNVTAYSSAHGEGTVISGHEVRFSFGTWSPYVQTVYDTWGNSAGFAADTNTWLNPSAFPGKFQVCATNPSLKTSYVRLRAMGS